MNGQPLSQLKAHTLPKSLDVCDASIKPKWLMAMLTGICWWYITRAFLLLINHIHATTSIKLSPDHKTTSFLWFWVDCDQFSALHSNINTFNNCLLFLEYGKWCRWRSQLLSLQVRQLWNQPQQLYIPWILVLTLDSQTAIRLVTNNYFFLSFFGSAKSLNKQEMTA